MASRAARFASALIRVAIRRHDWGPDAALARRARRLFGATPAHQRLLLRGLRPRAVATDSGVRGEWLDPGTRRPGVLLYLHGGGYVSCSAATHRPLTAALARATGLRVFAADYRLAPEHPFPAAHDDACAAYHWLVTQGAPGAPVVVAGESAGGGLVLAVAVHARDHGWPRPHALVALSPWADLEGTGASRLANDGRCAMFRPANIAAFARAYLQGASPRDPRASPLHAPLHGLPPVLLQVGAEELLLDDAVRVAQQVRAAGGEATLRSYPGAPHGWQLLTPLLPEARAAVDEVAAFVATRLPSASTVPPA